MSASSKSNLPPCTVQWLENIPQDRAVALLLRHAARTSLPLGSAGDEVPITGEGGQLAQHLGERLGLRLKTLHTSPVLRCLQTAEALRLGAGIDLPIVKDRQLGAPGAFVVDEHQAWQNWETLGHEGVVQHLMTSRSALPGMARPDEAARKLVHHLLAISGTLPGMHVFVTHDSLIAATIAQWQEMPLPSTEWPGFLEGVWFWTEGEGMRMVYRDSVYIRS